MIYVQKDFATSESIVPRVIFSNDLVDPEVLAKLVRRLATELNKVKKLRPQLKVNIYPFYSGSGAQLYIAIADPKLAKVGELVDKPDYVSDIYTIIYYKSPGKDKKLFKVSHI